MPRSQIARYEAPAGEMGALLGWTGNSANDDANGEVQFGEFNVGSSRFEYMQPGATDKWSSIKGKKFDRILVKADMASLPDGSGVTDLTTEVDAVSRNDTIQVFVAFADGKSFSLSTTVTSVSETRDDPGYQTFNLSGTGVKPVSSDLMDDDTPFNQDFFITISINGEFLGADEAPAGGAEGFDFWADFQTGAQDIDSVIIETGIVQPLNIVTLRTRYDARIKTTGIIVYEDIRYTIRNTIRDSRTSMILNLAEEIVSEAEGDG